MANVKEFNAQEVAEIWNADIVAVSKDLAIQGLEGVVHETPVKIGRAKGAWQVLPSADSTPTRSTPLDKDGAETIARGKSVIKRMKPFEPIAIVNAAPHAHLLEDGSSKQAPHGMMRIAIMRMKARFPRRP